MTKASVGVCVIELIIVDDPPNLICVHQLDTALFISIKKTSVLEELSTYLTPYEQWSALQR